ncbi:MAG: hypothetical protein ACTSPE_00305 [Candidatus Thorarchaeota archaeon]
MSSTDGTDVITVVIRLNSSTLSSTASLDGSAYWSAWSLRVELAEPVSWQ